MEKELELYVTNVQCIFIKLEIVFSFPLLFDTYGSQEMSQPISNL